jgi:hypothetical protein
MAVHERVVEDLCSRVTDLGVDIAHSALASASCQSGKSLNELAAFLARCPEALARPVSDCPPGFVRLAHVLSDAGYDVALAVCASCGRSPAYLRAGPGGRLCYRCSARVSRIRCARCGRDGRPAARRADEMICFTCYGLDPASMTSAGRVAWSAGQPCACRTAGRSAIAATSDRRERALGAADSSRRTRRLRLVRHATPATSPRPGCVGGVAVSRQSAGRRRRSIQISATAATRVQSRFARRADADGRACERNQALRCVARAFHGRSVAVRYVAWLVRSTPSGRSGRCACGATSRFASGRIAVLRVASSTR